MTKEELAALLHRREYCSEITKNEEAVAKAAGLIVIFGYSDDNVELRGALHEEVRVYEGGNLCITAEGTLLPMFGDIKFSDEAEAEEYFRKKALRRKSIKCEWSPPDEELSWRFITDMPHESFDVLEDGETYCRGIVISVADL